MSSSRAKSQAEQQRKSKLLAPAATPPAQDTTDPSKTQWMDTLNQEEADEIVGEIMDELMSNVMEGCYRVWIESQLIPYSASWAKRYLTQRVEHNFMCLDVGEGLDEGCRTEDSEPMPAPLDCWAQGCVPVVEADQESHHDSQQQETDIDHVPVHTKTMAKQPCKVSTQVTVSTKPTDEEKIAIRPVREKLRRTPCFSPPTQPDKKKQQFTLPLRSVQEKLLPPLSCSKEKKAFEIESKNVANSVVKQKTGSVHQCKQGNPIPKLEPSSLPKLCVFPRYEIVDDERTKRFSQDLSGLPKLSTKYSKHHTEATSSKQLNKSDKSKMRRNDMPVFLNNSFPSTHRDGQVDGPLRLDTMVLAKGVSLLRHQTDTPDPRRLNTSLQLTKMKPMQSDAARPRVPINEVISGSPPHITPILPSENSNN